MVFIEGRDVFDWFLIVGIFIFVLMQLAAHFFVLWKTLAKARPWEFHPTSYTAISYIVAVLLAAGLILFAYQSTGGDIWNTDSLDTNVIREKF